MIYRIIFFLFSINSLLAQSESKRVKDVFKVVETYDWQKRLRRIERFKNDTLHGESCFFNKKGHCVKIIPYHNGWIKGNVYFYDDEGVCVGIVKCGGHKTMTLYSNPTSNVAIPRDKFYKPKHQERIAYRWGSNATKRFYNRRKKRMKEFNSLTEEEKKALYPHYQEF